MKKFFFGALFLALVVCQMPSFAWHTDTHKYTVTKAFSFMESSSATSQEAWIAQYVRYLGSNQIDQIMADKCAEVDNMKDLEFGGWWIGYWTGLNLFGYDLISLTVYSHFMTMYRPGTFGNAYDGYNYKNSPADGWFGANTWLKNLFYNMQARSKGNAGTGISNPANGQGVLDAYKFQYQLSANQKFYSTTPKSNYEDFQTIIFEPLSNAASYWFGKALEGENHTNLESVRLNYLGHVMHYCGDGNTVQHVWDTSDHNHYDYEHWVDLNRESLYDAAVVREMIESFKVSKGITEDSQLANVKVQDIILFFALKTASKPDALYSKATDVYTTSGKNGLNGSIATNVLIMEKFIYTLYQNEGARKF